MGWRVQDQYDKASEKERRQWITSLPKKERLRFRIWQFAGIAILLLIVTIFFGSMWMARGA